MSTNNQNDPQTTGHQWDVEMDGSGAIEEFDNPIPTWWLWSFYISFVICFGYWILYPVWPMGNTFTKGISTIEYTVNGKQESSHWNTRALFLSDLQTGEESLKMQKHMDELSNASYDEILDDPKKLAFVHAAAKGIFGDICASCHGRGGVGVIGLFPNLADDDWLWGGKIETIEATIRHGRDGFMPAFNETFSSKQLDQVVEYVYSLSQADADTAKAAQGEEIFKGQTGGCHYCHTKEATGMTAMGSANLTDSIWTIADVPGAADGVAKRAVIRAVINDGVTRQMPPWAERLSDSQIKLLAVYVHQLGGGQ
ncbi:MAG: cytochrome-c oxidase, cbb3-type subunit III [Gammaproteobacteria bacterium]|nr:cytochrome-c oxidase, cbb3-type subunit III [Gammaproteobacteria bacterium]